MSIDVSHIGPPRDDDDEDPPTLEPNKFIGNGVFIGTDIYGTPYRFDADNGTWEELRRGDH